MTTTQIPRQPKHGHAWERDKPTLGAFILFVALTLAAGAYALVQNFQHASDVHRLKADEECQAQVFRDNLNRNAALSHLRDQYDGAQRRLDARWARDVVVQDVNDIPAAYNAFRAEVAEIDRQKASLGAVISASELPPGCSLVLASRSPTPLPSLTVHPPASSTGGTTSSNLPPLPSTVFVTVTRTTTVTAPGAVVTLTIPGPQTTTTVTVNPGQRTVHVTRTATTTVTVHPNQRTVTASRTVTVTVTRRPTRTTTHP
jgi:hypothetical protein